MKTIAKSLLTALLLGTATLATAENIVKPETVAKTTVTDTDTYKVAVFPAATPSKLNVFIERNPGQAMTISLKSTKGDVLGQQTVTKKMGSVYFQFNLADLKDGNYSVEVASGNDVTVYPITLSTQSEVVSRTITLE